MNEHDACMLWIVGASARAAAQSTRRAGWQVAAADLFADRDLQQVARVVWRIRDFQQLTDLALRVEPTAWCYTGGLENWPQIVERIADRHQLLGCSADALRVVRDPDVLAALFRDAQVDYPELRWELPTRMTGLWLRKPVRSCGGANIRVVTTRVGPGEETVRPKPHQPDYCYQRRVRGVAHSAVFVATSQRAILLGVTRQLVGCTWAGAKPFHYVGSIGPAHLHAALQAKISHIGNVLAQAAKLEGLFGVDLVVAGKQAWVVEVNPRFTASVEILERAGMFSAMKYHLDACRLNHLPEAPQYDSTKQYGKAILFAHQPLIIGRRWRKRLDRFCLEGNAMWAADLPVAGSSIRPGQPIVTILVGAATAHGVRQRLEMAARAIRST